MLKFNNNSIFTGYLKQLLTSINLPHYRVYTSEDESYHQYAIKYNETNSKKIPLEKNIIKTINKQSLMLYIKNGWIEKYEADYKDNIISTNGIWQPTNIHYHENKETLNHTKKFKIKNNIYDSYTHEYLGDFLRFTRDYYNVDLMPLYNCFSNNVCTNLKIHFSVSDHSVDFDTDDISYKIFMLPVKLFKKYTIAIDSTLPIEICCGFYGAYQSKLSKFDEVPSKTYKKINRSIFKHPFIYDKLSEISTIDTELFDEKTVIEMAENESKLKMFIKIPAQNTSSITILEGDFTGYNNSMYYPVYDNTGNLLKWQQDCNHFIVNFDKNVINNIKLNPITNLQLLSANTGISYPFSDKLIEYLVGNVITSEDIISDNIKRVQTVLDANNNFIGNYGIWNDSIKLFAYDYITNNSQDLFKLNIDLLGFVDKNIEKYYTCLLNDNVTKVSISNVDIYSNK